MYMMVYNTTLELKQQNRYDKNVTTERSGTNSHKELVEKYFSKTGVEKFQRELIIIIILLNE